MAIYVKCKTEDCEADVLAQPYAQVPFEKLTDALHKNNYYLCPECGKLNNYELDDHFES